MSIKKIGVLFLFLILFGNFIFASNLDSVQEKVENAEEKFEQTRDIKDKLSDEDARSEYLKSEWYKILQRNTFFNSIFNLLNKISPYTSPFFGTLLKITPSLSWVFILSLTLFVTFIIYFYRIFHFSFFSGGVSFLMAILFVIILGVFGMIKSFAEFIVGIANLWDLLWMKLLFVLIVFIGFIFANIYSKAVEEFFKDMKERREKIKEELEEIETVAAKEDIKSFVEAIREGIGG